MDDHASPLWDQPALPAAFDFHISNIYDEVDGWRAADTGTEGPFCGVYEAAEVFFFQDVAAYSWCGIELDLGVDCEVRD